jgi:hypothetical protein
MTLDGVRWMLAKSMVSNAEDNGDDTNDGIE